MRSSFSRRELLAGFASTLVLSTYGTSSLIAHDRPYGPLNKTRSAVLSRNGMAATSHPLASSAAIQILQNGGNAIDAAIAANAVLGAVEPMSCGIGGDLFAIIWDAKTKKLHGLNASGRSPKLATIEWFHKENLETIPSTGPLSWSVPGCVDGWAMLRDRFGTMPLGEVLDPAIGYAESGFPVSEIIAGDWQGAETTLSRIPTSRDCFLPQGRAPKFGDVITNPYLARSLRLIAEHGRDAFYQGQIASKIDAYSKQVGGLIRSDDLASHKGNWIEPVSTSYRGFEVWELPPNGQGIAVLQMLNFLEPFNLKEMGPQSAEAIHLMIEAKKLAYEDRARFYADPEKSKIPVTGLISKTYAKTRSRLISLDHASEKPTAGNPPDADTIYMTVVDKDRNCVSLIQSNFNGFGSGHVPADLGFALQNRGCLFSLDPNHLNRLEPGKRPFHTIIPGFVTKDGAPWLSFGVMGGDMQPQGHVQVLTNMIDFHMDVQSAGDAPRWRHLGSSEPTGEVAKGGGSVALESGVSTEVRRKLESKGHVLTTGRGGFGGYQAIRIDGDRGILMGGSDPRKDGAAIGY